MTVRVLKWESPEGPKYYDISTDDLLRGAALNILEERLTAGFLRDPRPLEDHILYKMNQKKISDLEMAIGENNEEEAFENMQYELKHLRTINRRTEERYQKDKQQIDKVKQCLGERDGAAAMMILADRANLPDEKLEVLEIPQYLEKTEEPVSL